MPPMVVATPSARSTLPISDGRTRLPTISPVAMVLPVDSTAMIIITITMVMMATMSNLGIPKANGGVKPNIAAWPTRSKFMSPSAYATAQPATRPSSTAMVDMKPRKNRWIATITAMVPSA